MKRGFNRTRGNRFGVPPRVFSKNINQRDRLYYTNNCYDERVEVDLNETDIVLPDVLYHNYGVGLVVTYVPGDVAKEDNFVFNINVER